MATRKMTLKYWNSLSKGSRERALHHVFPTLKFTVEMLLDEQPNLKNDLWKFVWRKVRIPIESYYKTVVNGAYLP